MSAATGQAPADVRRAPGRRLSITADTFAGRLDCSAVLFDMDGTLVDSRVCVRRTWLAWCRRHGLDSARLFDVSDGRRNRETVQIIAPHLDVEVEVAALVTAEEGCRDGLRAIPGAVPLLAGLPEDCWAVVTSAWRRLTEIRLDLAGLPTPAVTITAEDVHRGKPDPEGYRQAAAALGVAPADCGVFEDAPAGLAAAAAAGMVAIRVGYTPVPPGLRCRWHVPDLTGVQISAYEATATIETEGRSRLTTRSPA